MKLMKRQHTMLWMWLLLASVLIFFFLNLLLGSVHIPPGSVWNVLWDLGDESEITRNIIMKSRVPQALTAIVAGAGLAVSGLLMQTVFRNPLAGPSVLGISSGASLGVAFIILLSTWDLLHDSIRLSLDGVPAGIDSEEIARFLLSDPRVVEVHHLHIWAISTTQNALTAHIVVDSFDDTESLKHDLRHHLQEKNIQHATFELERPGEHCHADCC